MSLHDEQPRFRRNVEWKKFFRYQIEVDYDQDDKAKEILLCSFGRPHMRAFHCSWWAAFVAYFLWFDLTSLLPVIKNDLHLTTDEVWISSIANVAGTAVIRLILGPLCDLYGPKKLFALVLFVSAIPGAMCGLVHSSTGFIVLRTFIGFAGGTLVMNQYWVSHMFTKEVIGTANGLVSGWGHLGVSMTQLLIGSALFPLFVVMFGGNESLAWRTVVIIPALASMITSFIVYNYSDDTPKGDISELRGHCQLPKFNIFSSFKQALKNKNTWLLAAQYACCLGVELTMYTAAALYFQDVYGQSTEAAGAIASIFGWLNLFARGLGGFASDYINAQYGMRGRLWMQSIFLFLEGCFVLIFAATNTLGTSIIALVFFSLFTKVAEGTTFAIVPYIDFLNMGSVIGLVGAGGSLGSVVFQFIFRALPFKQGFFFVGFIILASSFLSVAVHIDGYSGLLQGFYMPKYKETEKDDLNTQSSQERHKNEAVEEAREVA